MRAEADFAALPAAVRAEAAELEAAMMEAAAAPRAADALRRLAQPGRRGWSEQSLRRKFYAWKRGGWRALVDRAKAPERGPEAPDAVGEAFKAYAERNQRATKPGWRQMMRDFRAGREIPGAGDWREVWSREHGGLPPPDSYPEGWVPRGWTYGNLQRRFGLTPYEAAAARVGAVEARRYCPPVRTTRAGMRPGMVYQLDDVWHDIRVLRPGAAGTGRPLEYCAMDLATAHKAAKFLRVESEEGGRRERLKRWQLKAVVASLLADVGFDPGGCTLVVEHGTAGLTDAEKDAVRAASAGLVEFRGGDILGRQVLAGAFAGQGHGNFRAKALLEGAHRLLHYEAAHLPGQTGGNSRSGKPEGLFGLERLAARIARIGESVPPEFRQLLWAGALPWATYQRLAQELEDAIDERTDHRLEGWEANGWTVAEWSPDGEAWRPAAEIPALPPLMRRAAEEAMRTAGLHRLRRMSPREAWDAGRGGLRRLPPWSLADFMGDDCRVRARVRLNGLVEFQSRELFGDAETQRYLAEAEEPGGGLRRLRPLTEVDLTASPIWPWAVAMDPATGAVIGTLRRWESASQARPETMGAAAELAARVREGMNAPIRARHAEESAAALAAREHAEAVLEEFAPAARKAKPAAAADLGEGAFRALEGMLKGALTGAEGQQQEEEEWK